MFYLYGIAAAVAIPLVVAERTRWLAQRSRTSRESLIDAFVQDWMQDANAPDGFDESFRVQKEMLWQEWTSLQHSGSRAEFDRQFDDRLEACCCSWSYRLNTSIVH